MLKTIEQTFDTQVLTLWLMYLILECTVCFLPVNDDGCGVNMVNHTFDLRTESFV